MKGYKTQLKRLVHLIFVLVMELCTVVDYSIMEKHIEIQTDPWFCGEHEGFICMADWRFGEV
eukprot:14151323-Ditylum_brightwellii.AAC.1